MIYNFIEIGTSDFDTLIGTTQGPGLSVEPLDYYLNRLPSDPNTIRANFALTNFDGGIKIFWVTPENIKKYNLPHWVRGCNSVNAPHPTIKELLGERHDEIVNVTTVPCYSWSTFIKIYDIQQIHTLKIDTEGHDAIILSEYLKVCKSNPNLLADSIWFENNILSNPTIMNPIIDTFISLNYKGNQSGDDYFLTKNYA